VLEPVANNIRKHKLFTDGEHILVAVSGGIDSVVLLHLLHHFAVSCGWQLTIAHFNHKLRGRESDADERFVRTLAKKLNVPIIVDSANVKAHAKRTGQSIEMAARELRHAFFVKAARARKIKTVALAHHADDQVELFFLRLLRGSSIDGLAGMKWRASSPNDKTIHLARPLLNISREQIETFAHQTKLRWREDRSNQSTDFLRNRIRGELIPLLAKSYQPAVRANIVRTMEILAGEADLLQRLAKKSGAFDKLPVALQRRKLQQELFGLNLTADFAATENLRLHLGRIIELNPSSRVWRDKTGRVHIANVPQTKFSTSTHRVKLQSGETKTTFANCQLIFRIVEKTGAEFVRKPNTEYFDADKTGRVITLRHWQPGDRFHPIGAKAARKLQDIFVDLKVPQEQRHIRIIATTAKGDIFWVEGVRIGENFKLTASTKRRLAVQWKRD
jgi:tRNA(Ile)-lysidine synthase